ncbi:hypothetical protein FO488_15790 [Geobacter sp. FeAm09]|uniref:hypothetical protein n=1 Tax=Geobacter sp. FeAm09 TaxID=2597769 RepID=UPI0011EDE821|nr:hypothetical protein [Geobacter sp. FeAm09]QEM69473.1 hypothetical protein FO488_15790 [Geobacter sp. FeAm09]
MTITQLVELIRHMEEEHNFFNRKPGQRVVKQLTPHISMRGAARVVGVDLQGYGWEKTFGCGEDRHDSPLSLYHAIMAFLDAADGES